MGGRGQKFPGHSRRAANAGTLPFGVRAGIRLQSETTGTGREARLGDSVTVAYTLTLNRGDVVQTMPSCTFVLGRRQVVAALEYGVIGMCVGGRRQYRAGSHLAYGEEGLPPIVPGNAVLVFDVTLLGVEPSS